LLKTNHSQEGTLLEQETKDTSEERCGSDCTKFQSNLEVKIQSKVTVLAAGRSYCGVDSVW
jgi:hypothetical protein